MARPTRRQQLLCGAHSRPFLLLRNTLLTARKKRTRKAASRHLSGYYPFSAKDCDAIAFLGKLFSKQHLYATSFQCCAPLFPHCFGVTAFSVFEDDPPEAEERSRAEAMAAFFCFQWTRKHLISCVSADTGDLRLIVSAYAFRDSS